MLLLFYAAAAVLAAALGEGVCFTARYGGAYAARFGAGVAFFFII
jgi:hypothetical protein